MIVVYSGKNTLFKEPCNRLHGGNCNSITSYICPENPFQTFQNRDEILITNRIKIISQGYGGSTSLYQMEQDKSYERFTKTARTHNKPH